MDDAKWIKKMISREISYCNGWAVDAETYDKHLDNITKKIFERFNGVNKKRSRKDILKFPTKKFKQLRKSLDKIKEAEENIHKYYGVSKPFSPRREE